MLGKTRIVRLSHASITLFGLWAKQIAEEQKIPFIDLNDITARKFEKFGKEKVKYMFYLDRIHTSAFGAKVNAESAAEGIREYAGLELANYLKPIEQDTITGSSRKRRMSGSIHHWRQYSQKQRR